MARRDYTQRRITNIAIALHLEQVNSCNFSNLTMRTGLDFKSAQFDKVRGEAEDWIGMRGLEIYSPVRIGEFEMTSRTNK
jgi:hypothetical protein